MCKVTTFSINLLSFMLVFMCYCIICVCITERFQQRFQCRLIGLIKGLAFFFQNAVSQILELYAKLLFGLLNMLLLFGKMFFFFGKGSFQLR